MLRSIKSTFAPSTRFAFPHHIGFLSSAPLAVIPHYHSRSTRVYTPTRTMADMTHVLSKEAAPPAGPYTQAIKANGMVFVSGQIPADASGNLIEGTIGEKTVASIKNISAVLEAAGSHISKVVKVNVFLTDMTNFAPMNEEYEKYFTHKPARSCVAVYQLPKGVPVEVEVIALQ